MLKRIRWMAIGAAAGAGGTIWARQRVRRTVERYLPAQVSAEVAAKARAVGTEVRAAVRDGRQAMVEREAQLRAGRSGPRPPDPETGPPPLRVVGPEDRPPRAARGGRR